MTEPPRDEPASASVSRPAAEDDERADDPAGARRVHRRTLVQAVGGMVLLIGGGAVIEFLRAQPAQRLALSALFVPVMVVALTVGLRDVRAHRRAGTSPSGPEAARRLPLLAGSTVVFGWGLGLVMFQALSPRPSLLEAASTGLPVAVAGLAGLYETWLLRRDLNRAAASPDQPRPASARRVSATAVWCAAACGFWLINDLGAGQLGTVTLVECLVTAGFVVLLALAFGWVDRVDRRERDDQ